MTSLPHTPAASGGGAGAGVGSGVGSGTTNGGGVSGGTASASASAPHRPPPTVHSVLQQFWRDDYAPLQLAGEQVLRCLRDDEASSDADLYRRIATSSTAAAASASASASSTAASTSAAAPTGATAARDVGSFSGYRLSDAGGGSGSNAGSSGNVIGGGEDSSSVSANVSPRLVHVKSVPLPPPLREALKGARTHAFLGLLAPAQLGWMSVDDRLALWRLPPPSSPLSSGSAMLLLPPSSTTNQQQHQQPLNGGGGIGIGIIDDDDASPICQFRVPSGQPIVTVGLVRPKPGVFVPTVEWCVVVTTPDQVLLCVLNRTPTTSDRAGGGRGAPPNVGEYRFVPTAYSLSTEHVVLCVAGTCDGRIFLGGDDGSLSEMTYQGGGGGTGDDASSADSGNSSSNDSAWLESRSVEDVLEKFYDEGIKVPAVLTLDSDHRIASTTGPLARLTKRTWNALQQSHLQPQPHDSSGEERPRKCARLNRHQSASGAASWIVPAVLAKATSVLFGAGGRHQGKIVKMAVDEHRQTLYTLSVSGVVTAHDLRRSSSSQASNSSSWRWCSMDVPRVARSYLEAVARGQMYPPNGCSFPGGEVPAQAGVGGMEGARKVLKAADFGSSANGNQKHGDVLRPVAIHVLSPLESQRLTLVAVTSGGLRLYLSSLAPGVLSTGPNAASRYSNHPLAPSSFTLCHIRATPPADGIGAPCLDDGIRHVDASYYYRGAFLAALDRRAGPSVPNLNGTSGNVMLATGPDSVLRPVERPSATATTNGDPTSTSTDKTLTYASGGMAEAVSKPLESTDGRLPGGLVWEIAEIDAEVSSVEKLMTMSQTPTDSELDVGAPPPFFPSSKLQALASQSRHRPEAEAWNSRALARPVGGTLSSAARVIFWDAITRVLPAPLAAPFRRGLQFQAATPIQSEAEMTARPNANYRISQRPGIDGYSTSAAEESSTRFVDNPRPSPSASPTARSARLRSWLLRPASVPLGQLATFHVDRPKRMLALNAGGLHYFSQESTLSRLVDALVEAGESVASDLTVTSFFTSYGYKEGCAMCLALAIGCGPADGVATYSEQIRGRAKSAALARAFAPRLVAMTVDATQSGSVVSAAPTGRGSVVPPGYEFIPSELSGGLFTLFSRLVRPFWYKPAVVVTEGRLIRLPWSRGTRATPAKVELLLCERSLKNLLSPLVKLHRFMKSTFSRAVKVVPGGEDGQETLMDIDDDTHIITDYHSHLRAASGASSQTLTASEAETIARLIEEKNIHCLYRLLSRVVQLLNLISLLHQAVDLPELNEVDWGLLHGITFAQLVQTSEGHERLESLLNTLVTGSAAYGAVVAAPSAHVDRLAQQFASDCYLFFSPGSRSAYFGFRYANEALACPLGSQRRDSLAALAAENLKSAALHWYSPLLISGRVAHSSSNESVDQVALRARQFGSPLEKAMNVLIQLGDVSNAVALALLTASNFKSDRGSLLQDFLHEDLPLAFPWELNLYHKRRDESANEVPKARTQHSPTQAVAFGASVSSKDAIDTCYALIFYYVSELVSAKNDLGYNMVSSCSAAADADFLERFYSFLLCNGHRDTLLLIESADLETWLRSKRDPELLLDYLQVQKRDSDAGEVSWSMAMDTQAKTSLRDRIEHLRQAASAFKAASDIGGAASVTQKTQVVTDTLQVAMIQLSILEKVSIAKTELGGDEMERLSASIVGPTELYNTYAAPLGLFEECLLLLHSCRERDDRFIELNWKGVICEELLPCETRSEIAFNHLQRLVADLRLGDQVYLLPETNTDAAKRLFEGGYWSDALEARIVHLGRKLYNNGADYVFPIDFLRGTLQVLAEFVRDLEPQWSLLVLIKVGVPFGLLLDSYESALHQNGENNGRNGFSIDRLKQSTCIVDLLECWISSANSPPYGDRDDAKGDLIRSLASGRLIQTMCDLKAWLQLSREASAQALLERVGRVDDQLDFFRTGTRKTFL